MRGLLVLQTWETDASLSFSVRGKKDGSLSVVQARGMPLSELQAASPLTTCPVSLCLFPFFSAISPRTRAIVINTPHNPTGKVFTREELEAVAEVVRENPRVREHHDGKYARKCRIRRGGLGCQETNYKGLPAAEGRKKQRK